MDMASEQVKRGSQHLNVSQNVTLLLPSYAMCKHLLPAPRMGKIVFLMTSSTAARGWLTKGQVQHQEPRARQGTAPAASSVQVIMRLF